MQAAVKDLTPTIPSNLKDVSVEFENFLAQTVKNSNTYRQKREKNFLDIKTATINYLDAIKAEGKITEYKLELTQSGAKQMGIYLVGKVTLTSNDGEAVLNVKNKMNTWNDSGDIFQVAKPKKTAPVAEEITTEAAA
jgi:type VI protein secretion system component VasA